MDFFMCDKDFVVGSARSFWLGKKVNRSTFNRSKSMETSQK